MLILGARYGDAGDRDLSPTHQEYREARDHGKSVLVFVERGATMEARQTAFLREVRDWSGGTNAANFTEAADLRDLVTQALKRLEVSRAQGQVDPTEMVARARSAADRAARRQSTEPMLLIHVAPGPKQQMLRPAELQDATLQTDLERDAIYGPNSVLVRGAAVETVARADELCSTQADASICLDREATISLRVKARRSDGRHGLAPLIEEDIRDIISRALRFAGATLDRVDRVHRLTEVAIHVEIANAGFPAWRTRAEHQAEPNSMPMRINAPERPTAELDPPNRPRAALLQQADALAEDLTILLRDQLRP